VIQGVGSEFKPQYHKNKKERKRKNVSKSFFNYILTINIFYMSFFSAATGD
jgi:hypothetical protein